jgi:predicted naringenin-chalcone synthase
MKVVEMVGDQYRGLCNRHPGDPDYQRDFAREVETGLRMARRLGIRRHPVHVPPGKLTRPRGLRKRNQEATDAFFRYVPLAARRAMARAGIRAHAINAVLIETSTVLSMPSLAFDIVEILGLRSDTEALPYYGMGCNGGAHAIARARDYLLAHPDRVLLVIAADYASPHFHLEPGLRGHDLRGAVISSALFADATAAALFATDLTHLDGPGFEIIRTASVVVPGTRDALYWHVDDDGLHFRLTDMAMKLVPDVAAGLAELLASQGWSAADLSVCSFHSGGDRIIRNVADALGLTSHQVQPTRESLLSGNAMSVAVLDAMRIIALKDEFRPGHGDPGMGGGFGPGFTSDSFLFRFRHPAARPAVCP